MPDLPIDGRQRVIVARVSPEIECGRFAIKRVVGETVIVEADVFADGHDLVFCQILYKQNGHELEASPMKSLGNDRWRGEFTVRELGSYCYTVEGWIDRFATWRGDLEKRISAGQDVSVDLLIGADLIERAAARAASEDTGVLQKWAKRLRENAGNESGAAIALDPELLKLVHHYPERDFATRYDKQLSVVVEREKARFSTWYEVFPRSCSPEPGVTARFAIARNWLPYIAGWDSTSSTFRRFIRSARHFEKVKIIRFRPNRTMLEAHGRSDRRKAAINLFTRNWAHWRIFGRFLSQSGGPWAGGRPRHRLPVLARSSLRARTSGMVPQASRRHHPIRGKSAQKISGHLPSDFETPQWRELWEELKSIFVFWIEQGVRIFRVDNPHTKAFRVLGVGDRRDQERNIRTCFSSPRHSPGRT